MVVLEGFHALKHALRFDAKIEAAYTDDLDAVMGLAEALAPDLSPIFKGLVAPVSADVFQALAPRPPKTGVFALAARPSIDAAGLVLAEREAPAVLLENPAHLGNIGAVVRVAAAAGASSVLTLGNSDPWDPAAIRGAAGLHFALPVLRLERCPTKNGPLIAIDPEGALLQPEALPSSAILAFGSERQGLSSDVLEVADLHLSLPMCPNVSSLNLATAVSAVLYAWRFARAQRSVDSR